MAIPIVEGTAPTVRLNTASTNYVVDYPSGIVAGELLVAAIYLRSGVLSTISTVPSGWNLIDRAAATNGGFYLYWRLATGTETGTATWVGSTSATQCTAMRRISGADTTTPINVVGTLLNDSATQTPEQFPTVTTTEADCLLWNVIGGLGTATISSWTNGQTTIFSGSTGGGTSRFTHGGSLGQASAGSSGTLSVNLGGAANCVKQTFAIQPAAAAPAAPVHRRRVSRAALVMSNRY